MRILVNIFCSSVLLLMNSVSAADIADLDRIQDQAKTLEEFLNNEELLLLYLKGWQTYSGGADEFPELSYRAIVKKLRELAKIDPVLAERAWSKDPLGPTFSLRLQGQNQRVLKAKEWRAFLQQQIAEVRLKSGEWKDWWLTESKSQVFIKAVFAAEAEIEKQLKLSGYSKDLLERLIDSNESLIAALLLYQLSLDYIREDLNSSHWDQIGARLLKLAKLQDLTWGPYWERSPKLVKYWKMVAPDFLASERKSETYTESLRSVGAQELVFRGVRPFHALFDGIKVRECTAGDCEMLERLSARRFAIPLLTGVWNQFVEENGIGIGHIQIVPLVDSRGRRVLNPDLMVGRMRDLIPGEQRTIFEYWLSEIEKRMPKGTTGVAIGESLNADNEGMQHFVRSQKAYTLGFDLGDSNSFEVEDTDMAYRISRLSWGLEKSHFYGNCLTFDGCDSQSGRLRMLNSKFLNSQELEEEHLKELWDHGHVSHNEILNLSSQNFQKFLAKERGKEFLSALTAFKIFKVKDLIAYIDYLNGASQISDEVVGRLKAARIALIKRGLGGRAKVEDLRSMVPKDFRSVSPEQIKEIELLDSDEKAKLMRIYVGNAFEVGRFDDFQNFESWLLEHAQLKQAQILSWELFEYLGESCAQKIQGRPWDYGNILAMRRHFSSVATGIAILRNALENYSDPESLLVGSQWVFDIARGTKEFKVAYDEYLLDASKKFYSLNPSTAQIEQWLMLF